jgi:hypothetical protein
MVNGKTWFLLGDNGAVVWDSTIEFPKAIFDPCLQPPGGDGGGFHVAKGDRAQAGMQRLHHKALVGAERSRVGIWLGLHVLRKPDDDTGTRSGESLMVSANLILQSDTVWQFSSRFVMIQADAKRCKGLIIKAGMTWEDS